MKRETVLILTTALFLLVASPLVAGDSWSHDRYDSSNSAGYSSDGGASWAFDVGVEISSSVVPVDGDVFFYDAEGKLHSFDPDEGERNWVYDGGAEPLGAPIVYDGIVVAETSTGLAALDGDGEVLWRESVDLSSSPAVDDGRVYMDDGGRVLAVSLSTGRTMWSQSVAGDMFMFSTVEEGVFGTAAESDAGERVEEAVAEGVREDYWEGRVMPEKIDFYEYVQPNESGYRLQRFDGDEGETWGFSDVIPIFRPAVSGSNLYVSTLNYEVYSLDAETGEVRWSMETDEVPSDPPVYYEGTVFVGDRGGNLYSFDAFSGDLQWKEETPFDSAPELAVSDGIVHVVSRASQGGGIHAYDTSTGDPVWSSSVGDAVSTPPNSVGSTVYLSTGSEIYAIYEGEVAETTMVVDEFASTPRDDEEEIEIEEDEIDEETTDEVEDEPVDEGEIQQEIRDSLGFRDRGDGDEPVSFVSLTLALIIVAVLSVTALVIYRETR